MVLTVEFVAVEFEAVEFEVLLAAGWGVLGLIEMPVGVVKYYTQVWAKLLIILVSPKRSSML